MVCGRAADHHEHIVATGSSDTSARFTLSSPLTAAEIHNGMISIFIKHLAVLTRFVQAQATPLKTLQPVRCFPHSFFTGHPQPPPRAHFEQEGKSFKNLLHGL
jgi:hypothetical protein